MAITYTFTVPTSSVEDFLVFAYVYNKCRCAPQKAAMAEAINKVACNHGRLIIEGRVYRHNNGAYLDHDTLEEKFAGCCILCWHEQDEARYAASRI